MPTKTHRQPTWPATHAPSVLPIPRLRIDTLSKAFVRRPRQAAGVASRSSAKIARNAAEAPMPITRRATRKLGKPGATPQPTTPVTRSRSPIRTRARVPWRARSALAG